MKTTIKTFVTTELRDIVQQVNECEKRSQEAEYTDTDDVWATFEAIRRDARRALRKMGVRT